MTCELRFSGRACPGHERAQYRSWFFVSTLGRTGGAHDACLRSRNSWQKTCGTGVTVEMRVAAKQQQPQEPLRVATKAPDQTDAPMPVRPPQAPSDCSASFLDAVRAQPAPIFPSEWPAHGLTPPFDSRPNDDVNATLSLIEAGAEASRHRQTHAEHVRAEARGLRSQQEALLCRWRNGRMRCMRNPSPLFGAPARSAIRDDRLAVVVAGMTRSFITAPMQAYWHQLVAALRRSQREPVVFAALSLESFYRGWTPGVYRHHNASEATAVLDALGVVYRVRSYTGGAWLDAARQACHPALRQAMTPPGFARRQVPGNHGFARRVVALDLLLRYELETGHSFGHVLFLRPDTMNPPLLDVDALARMWATQHIVVLVNDQLSVAPRALAGYLLAAFVMNRVMGFQTFEKSEVRSPPTRASVELQAFHDLPVFSAQAWPAHVLRRLYTSLLAPNAGSLVQPTTFLAYHGVLFAGSGLEFRPNTLPLIDEHGTRHPFASDIPPTCLSAMLRQVEPRSDLEATEAERGAPACFSGAENGQACRSDLLKLGAWPVGNAKSQPVALCETLEEARPVNPHPANPTSQIVCSWREACRRRRKEEREVERKD